MFDPLNVNKTPPFVRVECFPLRPKKDNFWEPKQRAAPNTPDTAAPNTPDTFGENIR
jgi:hypothetical protein